MTDATQAPRPECVCPNCFVTWRARRPRPPAVFCWHNRSAARLRADGWQVIKHPSDSELAEMRAAGLL